MLKALAGNIVMLKECVMMSLRNIVSNRLRSFLTALGILIGVCAVIALITTVSAVSGSLSSSFSSMGAGTLMVTVSGSDLKSGMTAEDLTELTAMDMVDGVSPAVSLSARVSRGGEYETGVSVSGKNAYYFRITEDALKRGRALNAIDESDSSNPRRPPSQRPRCPRPARSRKARSRSACPAQKTSTAFGAYR